MGPFIASAQIDLSGWVIALLTELWGERYKITF